MSRFKRLPLNALCSWVFVTLLLMACSGGGSSSDDESNGNTENIPDFVSISGVLTYDRVPQSENLSLGLDYNLIEARPIRGARVQLLDNAGNILDIDTSGVNGEYQFDFVASQQLVRIRVVAELTKTSLPAWDVQIRDHTEGGALYSLDGSLVTSGIADSERNLHADSGWDTTSSSYTGPRSAAPFAIMDTLYTGLQRLAGVDGNVRLDELDIFWSPKNSTAIGVFAEGDIGGTFYRNQEIYVLGQQNGDTDEYDEHVLLHEWGHFIEDTLSRTDTLGGRHNVVESLDFRLAFAEGFANAWAGMMLDDPIYRDSSGLAQASVFAIDIEENPDSGSGENTGWFVESSIHALLYDFYDDQIDDVDTISTGLGPIYNVLVDSDYIEGSALRSIYPFIAHFRSQSGVDVDVVDSLLSQQDITGFGQYGIGELNDGGDMNNLPVYIILNVNAASPTRVCTTSLISGEVNKHGNRRLLRFSTIADDHQFIISYEGTGFTPSNPAFRLFYQGQPLLSSPQPGTADYDTPSDMLNVIFGLGNAGEYILEVFSRSNVDDDFDTGGDVCFDVSVSR